MYGRIIHLYCFYCSAAAVIAVVGARWLVDPGRREPRQDVRRVGPEMHRPSLIMMTDRELAASGYVHDRLLAGAGAWVAELLDTLDAVQATLHE